MQLQSWKSCHVVQRQFARFGRRHFFTPATLDRETVDFPEVDADRKDEATPRDSVAEEVLVPVVGAPQTEWRVDRFPRAPARAEMEVDWRTLVCKMCQDIRFHKGWHSVECRERVLNGTRHDVACRVNETTSGHWCR